MFLFLKRHFTIIVCIQGFWHWVCWKGWKVRFWERVCGWRKLTLPGFAVSFYLVHFSVTFFYVYIDLYMCIYMFVYVYVCIYKDVQWENLNCNITRDWGKIWLNCNSYHFGWTFALGRALWNPLYSFLNSIFSVWIFLDSFLMAKLNCINQKACLIN